MNAIDDVVVVDGAVFLNSRIVQRIVDDQRHRMLEAFRKYAVDLNDRSLMNYLGAIDHERLPRQ